MTPQRFNILLIDDNASDARLFDVALREVAPRVTLYWVATAEEGIEALKREDRFKDVLGFDIVVVDLNMPLSDGFELIEKIKKDPTLMLKPVLVMSSSADPEDIRRCYRLGANSYFVKPMTLEGIHTMVRCVSRYWLDLAKLPPDV